LRARPGLRWFRGSLRSHLNHRAARWLRCEERQRRASKPPQRRLGPDRWARSEPDQ
jgi:hypothetical protein